MAFSDSVLSIQRGVEKTSFWPIVRAHRVTVLFRALRALGSMPPSTWGYARCSQSLAARLPQAPIFRALRATRKQQPHDFLKRPNNK